MTCLNYLFEAAKQFAEIDAGSQEKSESRAIPKRKPGLPRSSLSTKIGGGPGLRLRKRSLALQAGL
jgi:hypothetical protein